MQNELLLQLSLSLAFTITSAITIFASSNGVFVLNFILVRSANFVHILLNKIEENLCSTCGINHVFVSVEFGIFKIQMIHLKFNS